MKMSNPLAKPREATVGTGLRRFAEKDERQQIKLLEVAARAKMFPFKGTLRKIADLEVAIGAVEQMLADREGR